MDKFDFGELKNDTNLISKMKAVDNAIQKIEDMLSLAGQINYEELSVEEKVKYDIFLSYSINSLFFMYLKINGEDPNNHGIKNELARIKEVMMKEKQIQDKKLRPVVNQDAAKRFIRGGLYDHKQKNEEYKKKREGFQNPPNKKRKFE